MRQLFRRVFHALGRGRFEADLAEELEFHRAMRERDFESQGLDRRDAAFAARRALGNVELARERARDVWIPPWIGSAWQDVRFAARSLAKVPAFTTAAVLTLALGIGATTAIASMVYAVLLQPLPYREPARLVEILKRNPPRGWVQNPVSAAEIVAWRSQTKAFEDIAALTGGSCVLTGTAGAEEDPCETISSNLFPLLGVSPILGRTFTPEEDRREGPRAVILGHGLWQRRFGADRTALGRAIRINGAVYTIVGVMPPRFSHLYTSPYAPIPQLWTSGIGLGATSTWNDFVAVGRLHAGATLEAAQGELDAASEGVERAYPDLQGWRAQFIGLREMNAGDTQSALLVLLGGVIFVLLIASANVANLLLARATVRASEMAVRKALGAGRWRVIRQLLTESALLAIAGGSLGVLVASWGLGGLLALAPSYVLNSAPGLTSAVLDARVLALALGTSVLTTCLFGLAPAWLGARPEVADTLKETARGALAPRSRRFRSALLVAQVALAMVLLVGTGLMIRTLTAMSAVDLGFNPASVLTLRVPLETTRYQDHERVVTFWHGVLRSIEALPGVASASVSRGLPIEDWSGQYFTTEDRPMPPAGQVPDANYVVVGPHYFDVMQIPLRAGRRFDEHDNAAGVPVVIVNEELARNYWPHQSALGKRLRMGTSADPFPWLTVVGVAGNVLSNGPQGGVRAEVYVPYQQRPWRLVPQHLVVRSAGAVSPASLTGAILEAIHRVDRDVPAADVRTMEEIAAEPLGQQRMLLALLGAFASLALVLAALGVYSVLSYSVGQRLREIGVRVALGAERRDVVRLFVAGGGRLALAGIVVGIGAALALTRLMSDLLYGVHPADPLTFAAVSVLLVVVSLAACYVPARRAVGVNPVEVLRHE